MPTHPPQPITPSPHLLVKDSDGPPPARAAETGWAAASLLLSIYGFAEREVSSQALCAALARHLDCPRVGLLRLTRSGSRDRLLALAPDAAGRPPPPLSLAFATLTADSTEVAVEAMPWPGSGPWLLACIAAGDDCRYFLGVDPGVEARREWVRESMGTLLPHLRQAVRLRDTADKLRARVQVDAQVLNRAPSGFLVLNASGAIEFANEEAEHVLAEKDGLARGPHGLVVDDLHLRDLLALCLGELRVRDDHQSAEARSLQVRRASGHPPYLVTLLPVMVTGDDTFLAPRRRLLVVVSNAAPRRLPGLEYLQRTFGLTPGEARVCRAFCSADDTEGVALALRISVATAKTHLMRVYQKLEVNSRARLVQRLQGHYWVERPILVALDTSVPGTASWLPA